MPGVEDLDEPARSIAEAAVRAGLTVDEVRVSSPARAELVAALGLGSVSRSVWAVVWRAVEWVTVQASGSERARCRRCRLPVRWVSTEARGKAIPLDPLPHPSGNVVLVEVEGSSRRVARVLARGEVSPERTYRPHFATCGSRQPARPADDGRQDRAAGAAASAVEDDAPPVSSPPAGARSVPRGEVLVWCDQCAWTTTRPDKPGYARSARLAHRMREHPERGVLA